MLKMHMMILTHFPPPLPPSNEWNWPVPSLYFLYMPAASNVLSISNPTLLDLANFYTPFKNQITAVTSYIFLLFYFICLWVCLFLLPCVLTCHLFKYWASTATKALFQEEVNPSVKAGLQMWLVPHRTPAERLAPVAFQEMPQLFMNKWITGEGHRESV